MTTTWKGELGESNVLADLIRKGFKVAIPFGSDWKFDLILSRNGKLEKVQAKCSTSEKGRIRVRALYDTGRDRSSRKRARPYSKTDIDWLAVYDRKTGSCYYIPSKLLGQGTFELRVTEPKNGQVKNIRWAKDFEMPV